MKRFNIPVIYDDKKILAVNKPAGIPSIPDRFDSTRISLNKILESQYGQLWTLHRLDIDTSGVIIFARDANTHKFLSEQFQNHSVDKNYHAIVQGSPEWQQTVLDYNLLVDGDRFHRTIVHPKGKPSQTIVTLVEQYKTHALVEARLLTGRTHQIRVHLAEAGYPVCVDPIYGSDTAIYLSKIKTGYKGDIYEERPLIERTALHALQVGFVHPDSNSKIIINAPYPKDFKAVVYQLRKISGVRNG